MHKKESTKRTFIFITILCLTSALILGGISQALFGRQEKARTAYLYRQLFVSARILSFDGYFEVADEKGNIIKANFEGGKLVKTLTPMRATDEQIYELFKARVRPLLATDTGETLTFEEANISYEMYIKKYAKEGFYNLSEKLYYKILDETGTNPYGYAIPINGYGLWDAIYGLLSLMPNCNTILGISWYEQKETPGLGAEIGEAWWQKQFYKKQIFQKNPDGSTHFASAPLGITVVKPGMLNQLSKDAKLSAVDGISGATMTSVGVQMALKDSLTPYRPLFVNLQKTKGSSNG